MSRDEARVGDVVLSTDIQDLRPFIKGKVRDVYDLDQHLLVITTDRISAFDCILPTGIPNKGAVLNQLSAFWFEEMHNLCPSHFVTTDVEQIQETLRYFSKNVPDRLLEGRAMLVNKVKAFPVECVVRGYLEGSAWKEYQKTSSVCGIPLPAGLQQGSQLPEPIFTPSTKAVTGHDENITVEEMEKLMAAGHVEQVIDLSLKVYKFAAEYARQRGIIIADTKFEFGLFDETVVMIDECLTPDSSRFWDAERWKPGGPQPSFDKQYVRDYLDQVGWNHEPPAPELPAEVVTKTASLYREIYQRLTGEELA